MSAPEQWVVVLRGQKEAMVYGPTDATTAKEFAEYLTVEVDPASAHKLRSPTRELLAFWRQRRQQSIDLTENWPPKPGDIWQDRNGNRWSCQVGGYLASLAFTADDAPDEIARIYGPMALVSRPDVKEVECPF